MDNIFDIGVSYFHTLTTEIPVMAELYDLLTTDRYKDRVMDVRNAEDPATKSNLKTKLPSYTPSGIFERSGSRFPIKLNGFICIDIDKKDNLNIKDFDKLKDSLSQVSYIAYCGLSCGGEGYFCIVPLVDPFLFKSHFRSLQLDFANMGVTIDPACNDIGRKRFVSYDANPYINYRPEVYEGLADDNPICRNPQIVGADATPTTCYEIAQADNYIDIIEKKKIDITYGYPKWFRIGCAFANTFGEDGRSRFHRVSKFYHEYTPEETNRLYSAILKKSNSNPVTLKTFLYYAREAGVDKPNFDMVTI